MKFDAEFKEAISQLSSKEKDKLLFRLIKRDEILANQLYFELVSGDSVQGRRATMEIRIKKEVVRMTDTFYSPGYLLMNVRGLSGEIAKHTKITRDKHGEVSLTLLMLNEVLRSNNTKIANARARDSHTFCVYVIARAFKISALVKSMHEDLWMEFEDGLKELGQLISQNSSLMSIAIKSRFDVNWLIRSEIPDDIVAMTKEVRAMGLLK